MIVEFDIRKYKRHLRRQHVVRRTPVTLGTVIQEWKPMLRYTGWIVAIVLLYCLVSRAAENDPASLPDAPSAVLAAAINPAAIATRSTQYDENWLLRAVESKQAYRGAQWFLVGATAFDAVETWRGLTHPTQMSVNYCNPSGCHQASFDFSKQFSEGGWARFAGKRDAGGVVAANVALNVGVLLLSHELAKNGPRWRAVATALNAGKAAGSVEAGASWVIADAYVNNIVRTGQFPPGSITWKP